MDKLLPTMSQLCTLTNSHIAIQNWPHSFQWIIQDTSVLRLRRSSFIQPLIILWSDVQKVTSYASDHKIILYSVHNFTLLCTATNRSHVDLVIQIDTIHSFLLQYLQLQVSFSETYITHNNEKAITSNIIISDIKIFNFFLMLGNSNQLLIVIVNNL